MPPENISYWPSRARQLLFLVMALIVFIVSSAASLLLWLIGFVWVVLIVTGVVSAACLPIMLLVMLRRSPVLVLTPDGMRLRGNVLLLWEEIDEIHQYVHGGAFPHALIGLYLRDEETVRARLSAWAKWDMDHRKKQGMPPIAIGTQSLRESIEEILDDIEAYVAELQDEESNRRRLPKVYRRRD